MKSLKQYILESLEDRQIDNLIVKYDINNGESVVIEAPKSYSEDDITILLGDMWFNQFPGGKDNKITNKLFGKSLEKLIDAHLEYSSFKHMGDYDKEPDIKWDNKYAIKNSDNDELDCFSISNLQYLIQFESFDIKTEGEANIPEDLRKIFESTESSDLNKYPVILTLDDKKPFEYDDSTD